MHPPPPELEPAARRLQATLPISEGKHFRKIATALFPGLKPEEMQSFCADFETRNSPELGELSHAQVLDFLVQRLLAGTDPRQRRWLKLLQFRDAEGKGVFSLDEFLDFSSKMFPSATADVLSAAFASAAAGREDPHCATIEKLGATLSYLEACTVLTA